VSELGFHKQARVHALQEVRSPERRAAIGGTQRGGRRRPDEAVLVTTEASLSTYYVMDVLLWFLRSARRAPLRGKLTEACPPFL
jgi:hypothetical protein